MWAVRDCMGDGVWAGVVGGRRLLGVSLEGVVQDVRGGGLFHGLLPVIRSGEGLVAAGKRAT